MKQHIDPSQQPLWRDQGDVAGLGHGLRVFLNGSDTLSVLPWPRWSMVRRHRVRRYGTDFCMYRQWRDNIRRSRWHQQRGLRPLPPGQRYVYMACGTPRLDGPAGTDALIPERLNFGFCVRAANWSVFDVAPPPEVDGYLAHAKLVTLTFRPVAASRQSTITTCIALVTGSLT